MKLTVFHDGQYWVGVVEETDHGKLRAARHIFGSKPYDEEILQFVCYELPRITGRLSQEVQINTPVSRKISPKRLARQAAAEVKSRGVSTYAQTAIKLEYEKLKQTRRSESKQRREALMAYKRDLKVQKAKAKHRGH